MAQSRANAPPDSLGIEDDEEQSATMSTDSLTPEQQLLARFKLHKQHRKEKERRLQKTRVASASRASRSAAGAANSSRPQKPAAVDLTRVDHNNRPHRWKAAEELLQEQERRAQQRQLTVAPSVRPFPGKIRSQTLDESPRHKVTLDSREKEEAEKEAQDVLQLDQSQFPLHLFDSDEFEAYTPQQWLERESVGASPYFFQGEWRWRSCAVISYDVTKAQYLVQFQGSDRQKLVRRINLRFESESAVMFERRVAAARERREEAFQKLLLVQVGEEPVKLTTEGKRGAGIAWNGSATTTVTLAAQMPFRVLDFKALQAAHSNKVAEILLVDWRRALVENVIDNLQDHFDLFLSDRAAYDASRLKRVLTGLELRLAAQLREVVHRSVNEWVQFVSHHAESGSLVTAKLDEEQDDVTSSRTDAEEDDEDVPIRPATKRFAQMQKEIRAPRSSLFSVQLAFVNDEVVVEPSAQEVTATLLEPLDAVVAIVQRSTG